MLLRAAGLQRFRGMRPPAGRSPPSCGRARQRRPGAAPALREADRPIVRLLGAHREAEHELEPLDTEVLRDKRMLGATSSPIVSAGNSPRRVLGEDETPFPN
jgi:hypothetical protein